MSAILSPLLEGAGHVLTEAAKWIPTSRWDNISEAWAWPIGAVLAVGLVSLPAALWLGYPWLYRLSLGAFIVAFAIVCLAALCTRPVRRM